MSLHVIIRNLIFSLVLLAIAIGLAALALRHPDQARGLWSGCAGFILALLTLWADNGSKTMAPFLQRMDQLMDLSKQFLPHDPAAGAGAAAAWAQGDALMKKFEQDMDQLREAFVGDRAQKDRELIERLQQLRPAPPAADSAAPPAPAESKVP